MINVTVLKYGAAAAAIVIGLAAAYTHGYGAAATEYQATIDKAAKTAADKLATLQGKYRALEQQSAQDMAAIDQRYITEIQNRETISKNTIADLRSGAISLRKRFTSGQCPATATEASTSTSGGNAAQSFGLRPADAEFLVRIADEADQVADQLRACQDVVKADRK